jgi:hypothetical protein
MTCLVPLTRIDTFNPLSILADGWDLIIEPDSEREGVNKTRNKLFEKAINAGAEFIRFADDDDIVLPHRQIALNELTNPNIDVVYFDYLYDNKGQVNRYEFSGDLLQDASYSPPPWTFVVKTKSLNGKCPFDQRLPAVREGGYAFFEMIKMGLKFKHMPFPAYHWIKSDIDGLHLNPFSNDILFKLQLDILTWSKSHDLPRSSN